jgi:hypothetical protein
MGIKSFAFLYGGEEVQLHVFLIWVLLAKIGQIHEPAILLQASVGWEAGGHQTPSGRPEGKGDVFPPF